MNCLQMKTVAAVLKNAFDWADHLRALTSVVAAVDHYFAAEVETAVTGVDVDVAVKVGGFDLVVVID